MKKILVIIGIVVVIAAALFASPILGKEGKDTAHFAGNAYATEGGGGGF
jgi:hypothetical protein